MEHLFRWNSLSGNQITYVKAVAVSGAGVSSDESDVFIVRILQNIEEPTVTVNGTVSEDWYPDGTTITAVNNQIFGADIISLQYKYNTESDELWKGYPAEGGIPVFNAQTPIGYVPRLYRNRFSGIFKYGTGYCKNRNSKTFA